MSAESATTEVVRLPGLEAVGLPERPEVSAGVTVCVHTVPVLYRV